MASCKNHFFCTLHYFHCHRHCQWQRYVCSNFYQFILFPIISSPSGKLVQIEYALAAVAAGGPSVGIKGKLTCQHQLHKYRLSFIIALSSTVKPLCMDTRLIPTVMYTRDYVCLDEKLFSSLKLT